jgi:hypothetical protein
VSDKGRKEAQGPEEICKQPTAGRAPSKVGQVCWAPEQPGLRGNTDLQLPVCVALSVQTTPASISTLNNARTESTRMGEAPATFFSLLHFQKAFKNQIYFIEKQWKNQSACRFNDKPLWGRGWEGENVIPENGSDVLAVRRDTTLQARTIRKVANSSHHYKPDFLFRDAGSSDLNPHSRRVTGSHLGCPHPVPTSLACVTGALSIVPGTQWVLSEGQRASLWITSWGCQRSPALGGLEISAGTNAPPPLGDQVLRKEGDLSAQKPLRHTQPQGPMTSGALGFLGCLEDQQLTWTPPAAVLSH